MATKVIVSLPGEEDYAVRIGQGVMDALGRDVRKIDRFAQTRDVLVITDSNVGPLYLAQARGSLSQAGFKVADLTVPAGEASKSPEVASEIWQAMAQLALGRDALVVALGGGVVGDLAGFVASTYMRGVGVVQVPTSLLAMVDSSVGGKTAVNLPEGKNLVGTFFQPSFVCADTSTLKTLPEREWLCGCGEIAKSAVIDSDDFFFWLMDHAEALAGRVDEDVIAEAIARSVVFKADVVARDKTETAGVRECLNYGHTLGHALEACAGFGKFSHGACVAEGMRFAAQVTVDELAQVDAEAAESAREFAQAQAELLDELGLVRFDLGAVSSGLNPEALLAAMKRDKKSRAGELRFVLVNDVSKWRVVGLDDDAVLGHLRSWV
ncbi:MAG: 3-dehydroquinate synthase [Eggerthellaceae bacterium]|nr:3-dehydroquinate synthase [Eggerthellaceae bacterium]